MNVEAQSRALAASRKAVSSVFTDVGDDEESLIVAEAAPVLSNVRRLEYSADNKELQHRLDELRSVRGQSDFKLPPPKHGRSQSQNRHGDG